jgi:hypothetical protein
MNIISTIAELISSGYTHAQVAVELEVKHAIQVSEEWVRRITGADGFSAALGEAEAKAKAVVESPVEAVVDGAQAVVQGAESAGSDVAAEVHDAEDKVEAEVGKLEGDVAPVEEPAKTDAPSAPAQDEPPVEVIGGAGE